MGTIDFSPLAVTVQAVGTLLLAIMLAQLGRIFRRSYARRWAIGWASFFLALLSVRLDIHFGNRAFWVAYLVFEWVFLYLLWAGCREILTGQRLEFRHAAYAIPISIAVAAVLARVAPSFDDLFTLQTAIVGAGAAASFLMLNRRRECAIGCSIMRISLVLMAALYFAYVPAYAYYTHVAKFPFLEYSSLADLFVAVILGFGMIIITAEEANLELEEAKARAELKLNIDPLTEALNRHAFHSMQHGDEVQTDGVLSGVVVMIDVDNLKGINDKFGHAAGDAVIRAAANSVRTLIRADDLLFRWGGDEFVAIIPNSTLTTVCERLSPLSEGIVARVSPSGPPLRFSISWGGAEFDDRTSMDSAMKAADQAMYRTRSKARA
ncbi:MAG TPA: GGDEF domain-containing protein [Thermoanaerobaculia bacterium]|nr:GGDEF domain-containing protein [Thermoanaerobaculia bacterium]